MNRKFALVLGILFTGITAFGQSDQFEKIAFLLGEWSGTGSGFGNEKSKIESGFRLALEGKYIEVVNDFHFDPTDKNPEGEHHIDKGFISFDNSRNAIVYRQFNNEGYFNRYILNDSLSNHSVLVFDTEFIENFVPGGKARFTIRKISENELETIFDVSFPNKDYTCLGTNKLFRKNTAMSNKTPKVTGIGGIFFFSKNPKTIKEWYSENLGLKTNDWGSRFEFRNANNPEEINYLQWSAFKEGDKYFEPSTKPFMINYRVQNIEELVKNLKENGVTVVDEIESYDYGKFVHIMDPEGNKIELWEPVDHVFSQMGGETTK